MKGWFVVYKKELIDYFSDKRVRNSAIVMPIFLVVLMFYMFGMIDGMLSKPSTQTIYVLNQASLKGEAAQFVKALSSAKINVKNTDDLAAAKSQIEKGDIKLLLQVAQGSPGQLLITEYFDPSNQASQITLSVLDQVTRDVNSEAVKAIFIKQGLPPYLSQPLKVSQSKIHVGQKSAGDMVLTILPYIVVLWAFYGGMGAVGDIVAGEKEKNTLETLLTAPISRTEIAIGKLLTMATLCCIGSLAAILGVLLSSWLPLAALKDVMKSGIGIHPLSAFFMLAALIPTAFMFSTPMVALSARARNTREAMTQISFLSTIVILPAVFSQFLGYTDFANAQWVSAVPVLNSANTIRLALTGTSPWMSLGITVLVNGTLGIVFLMFSVRLFNRETILEKI